MPWEVIWDDECARWRDSLPEDVQDDIAAHVGVLAEHGPALGRPRVDTLTDTPIPNLKELRVQSGTRPYRILFAFDPRRRAILLVGGDKGGDAKWYRTNIRIAVRRARRHGIGR